MLRARAYAAFERAAVALVAYVGGYYLTLLLQRGTAEIGGLWSLISGVIVLQATRRDTRAAASLRVLGTLIGAIISGAYLSLLPFSVIGMSVCIGVTVLLCELLKIPDDGRLASVTVAVIMVVSLKSPEVSPVMNATLRFVESCIGTAAAISFARIMQRA